MVNSLTTVSREIDLDLDLMGVQNVKWDMGGGVTEPASNYTILPI
jgi:hypothetical protein